MDQGEHRGASTGRNPFWAGRRVFVTGATGFLGSWMVRDLRRHGAFVVGLVRDLPAEPMLRGDPLARPDVIVHGDIQDFDTLLRAINEYEAETVLHLAAQPLVGVALRDPRGTLETNIRGSWNLLEACRRIPTVKRIVPRLQRQGLRHRRAAAV